MLRSLMLSTVAGVAGTALGGFVGLLLDKSSGRRIGRLMSASAGMMLGIAFSELIPQALSEGGPAIAALSAAAGALCIRWLGRASDSLAARADPTYPRGGTEGGSRRLLRTGMLMFAAIALHNFPEGLAIGAGDSGGGVLGVTLAALIAAHNIPEGISIALPLVNGGMSRRRAILFTAASGAPTMLGGAAGALLGAVGAGATAAALGFAGGAMSCVALCEMIPQAAELGRPPETAACGAAGAALGTALTLLLG